MNKLAITKPICCLRRSLFTALIVTIGSTALAFRAESNDGVQAEEKGAVTRTEEKWLAALTGANVDVIATILAEDFERPAPDSGRFINKADLLSYYRSHRSPSTANKKHIEGLTVNIYGSAALARGAVMTTNSQGHVVAKLLFTDVFVRRHRQWYAVSAQENAVPTSVLAR